MKMLVIRGACKFSDLKMILDKFDGVTIGELARLVK